MAERPSFEELLDALDELHVPDGYKAETVRGNIVVSPWPRGYYRRVTRSVCRQLEPRLPAGCSIDRTPQPFVSPGVERAYGPDIHAAHDETYETDNSRLDGEGLCFVAELTSPATRDDDLSDKVDTYGKAGVPVHLALDMQEERATVLWTPSEKGYGSQLTRPFGERLDIPAPFNCTLHTSGFEAPAS